MNEKKKYAKPEAEIVEMVNEDIVTVSAINGAPDWNDPEGETY